EMETAGAAMAVTLVPVEIRTPEDLDPIFPALARERVDVVIVLRDPLFFRQRRTIAAAALATRLPTLYAWREAVDDGGLISYGGQRFPELSPFRRVRGQDFEGCQARRSAGGVSDQARACDQSSNCQGARPHHAADVARPRRRGDRMKRRAFIN